MALISINNLTFSYEGSYENIFENVNFQIDTDWKLGFTGRNGLGKTTFLNLLLGKYKYSGNISYNVEFEYFPYEVKDKSKFTYEVAEELLPDYQDWQLIKELNKLEVDIDAIYRPFETLSNGEQTKVLLAILFLKENSFLLIDEPTNHLDMEARKTVSKYLNTKKSFILVSHDRTFLDSCIDHILAINKTSIEIQKGNFSSWWQNKQNQDNYEIEQNEKLGKDIRRLEKAKQTTTVWSEKAEASKIGFTPTNVEKGIGRRSYQGEKSRKLMSAAKNIERRQQNEIDEKSKLLKNIDYADELKVQHEKYFKNNLVEFKNVALFYGEKKVCDNVSFLIEQGDKVALQGKNGSGKSSIIKLICGEEITYSGTVSIGSNLKISYICQDTSLLKGRIKDFASENNIDDSLFLTLLIKLNLRRKDLDKNIETLSAGQKKKILIAKSLCEHANLYIWDEPLNYIDVMSRIQIENLLKSYDFTILFVEHDKTFCDNIATKIITL